MTERHPHLLSVDLAHLIVIDVQEPFLRGIRERERVVSNVRLLLDAARILRIPVLATVQYGERMGGVVPEVHEKLPDSCPPMDKLCFSCGGDGQFIHALEESGRRQVLICGVETHICVCQTALDLLHRGFQVHVAADSVSSRSESTHEIGLRKMRHTGVIEDSCESAIYELMYRAGTGEFKQILKLLKDAD